MDAGIEGTKTVKEESVTFKNYPPFQEKVRYVRNKHGRKVGVFYSRPFEDNIEIGFSFCHTPLDKFDKEYGLDLAFERSIWFSEAKNFNAILKKVPEKYRADFFDFIRRSLKYYKDKNPPRWIGDAKRIAFYYGIDFSDTLAKVDSKLIEK